MRRIVATTSCDVKSLGLCTISTPSSGVALFLNMSVVEFFAMVY